MPVQTWMERSSLAQLERVGAEENSIDHAPILSTIVLAVYRQLIMRWQVPLTGTLPDSLFGRIAFAATLLLNPWVLSGIVATFLGGLSWLLAMSRFELSYAYPFVGLTFILVPIASFLLFDEQVSLAKVVGMLHVSLGVIVISRN